ncbi:transposase [Streptomyces sp. NPDC057781]|uniref:transposase n=1 Tax=unclassified Streptomyces TaxID=2593676 RepID=UPI0036C0184D
MSRMRRSAAAGGDIDLSVRRLHCENPACPRAKFVEQVDGLTERYQRRTPALRRLVEAVAVALAGSAAARLPAVLHQALSWATVLNCLMRIALPDRPPPVVAGIDEFPLLKGHRYATIIIDADSGQRVDVLPDRKAATVTAWLREHPGVRVVCRDGSGAFARATTDADPTIVQVGDRWHLWHGLAETALKEIGAHASCWSRFGPPLREGKRAAAIRERGSRSMTSLTRASACSHAPGVWASPSTRSSTTLATASRTVWSAPPSTGPASSIPTATTCANDETKTRSSPSPTCWRRSASRAVPAALTS